MNGSDYLDDERVAAWVEGELSAEEKRAFEEEMERNPELAEAVKEYQQTLKLLHNEAENKPPVSPEFLMAVQRRIRLNSRGRYYGAARFRLPWEVMGVLAVLVVMVFLAMDVMFPPATKLSVTSTRRVVVDSALSADEASKLGVESISLEGSPVPVLTLLVNTDNLSTVRTILDVHLELQDRDWLDGLKLDTGQSVRLFLMPAGAGNLPIGVQIGSP